MSRIRDLAAILGRTEAANPTNTALGTGSGGGGTDSAAVIQLINANKVTDSNVVINLISQNAIDSSIATSIVQTQVDSNYVSARSGGGGGGSGITEYDSVGLLPAGAAENEGSLAYVDANNKLYVSIGTGGWFPVQTVNKDPTLQVEPDGIIRLAKDGTATTVTLTSTDADSAAVLTFSAVTDTGFDGLATIGQSNNVFTITPKSEAQATHVSGTATFRVTDGQTVKSNQVVFQLFFGEPSAAYGGAMSATNIGGGGLQVGSLTLNAAVNRKHGIFVLSNTDNQALVNGSNNNDQGAVSIYKQNDQGIWEYFPNSLYKNHEQNIDTKLTGTGFFGKGVAVCNGLMFVCYGQQTSASYDFGGPAVLKFSDSATPFESVNRTSNGSNPASSTHYLKHITDDFSTGLAAQTTEYYNDVVCDQDGIHIVYSNGYDGSSGTTNAGGFEYVTRSGTTFTKRQTVLNPAPTANSYFGNCLAMSSDGLTLAVGHKNARGTGTYSGQYVGRVHVYKRDSDQDYSWSQIADLQPDFSVWDGSVLNVNANDKMPTLDDNNVHSPYFGASIDMDSAGQRMIVGMPSLAVKSSNNLRYNGGAFICNRNGDTWTIDQLLMPYNWNGTYGGTAYVQWNGAYNSGMYNAHWYAGHAVGINPEGDIVTIGAGNGALNNSGTQGSANGTLMVATKDSADADFAPANWRSANNSSYAHGRHKNFSYNQGNSKTRIPFISSTAFLSSESYNSNTLSYIYDSG